MLHSSSIVADAPILMIDDDASLTDCYRELLVAEGIATVVARNHADAYAWLDKGVAPRLVLVDYSVPDVDVLDFVRDFRKSYPQHENVRIVVFSGHSETSTAAKEVRAIGVEYVEKPFDVDRFIALVKRLVGLPA